MRRMLAVVAVLTVFDVAVLVGSALVDAGGGGVGSGVRVGLVFDVGGRGDKSFNDSAFAGLERARAELGVQVEFIEPGEGSDRESALRMFASRGFDLVIGTGFIFTDDLKLVAREYPGVAFAGVDYALEVDAAGEVVLPPENLLALKFREEEGSFLVGALAALVAGERGAGRVGFGGGMDIPLIRRFEAGYRSGVRAVCGGCEVLVNYAGVTPGAFKDPGKGKELALAQYRAGVRVIFHASGTTGLGVFEAAREVGGLAIGVDSDQYHEAPGYVLTSMVKRVDTAIFEVVRSVQEGRFEGGVRSFGLAEDGVGWVDDGNNAGLVPAGARARLAELRARIEAGEIDVPRRPE
jgi:basic membrane protein A